MNLTGELQDGNVKKKKKKTPGQQAGAGTRFEAGQVDYRWEVDICVYKHTGPYC